MSLGQPINSGDAQLYMNKYAAVKKTLKDKVISRLTLGEINADPDLKDCVANFYSDENAFIFTRDMVDKFFSPPAGDPVATHLMIFLGTKFNGVDAGKQTVFIAGVNQHPTKADTYVSLDILLPAVEQPPRSIVPTFPVPRIIAQGLGDMEFKIL